MARSYAHATDDYSPFEDDYRGFDLRESEEGQKGPLILLLAVGVLLIFGSIVWNAYRTGFRATSGGIPVISAPAQPYKYAYATKSETTDFIPDANGATAIEALSSDERVLVGGEPEFTEVALEGGPPTNIRRGLEGEDEKTSEEPVVKAPADVDVIGTPIGRPAAGRGTSPTTLPQSEPTLVPDAATLATSNWQIANNGKYLVQVGAFRTEAAARGAWGKLQARQPNLLGQIGNDIQRADLGAKGVFFRLRANSFVTRADAVSFCDALKSNGESCIVVSR